MHALAWKALPFRLWQGVTGDPLTCDRFVLDPSSANTRFCPHKTQASCQPTGSQSLLKTPFEVRALPARPPGPACFSVNSS